MTQKRNKAQEDARKNIANIVKSKECSRVEESIEIIIFIQKLFRLNDKKR